MVLGGCRSFLLLGTTSFIKDTTDLISVIEKTKIRKDTILVSMDVSSLHTNIPVPQEEETE